MPLNIKPNEDRDKFISRCISKERSLGKSASQAAAICYSVWRNRNIGKKSL
jgi:hypothetical protein